MIGRLFGGKELVQIGACSSGSVHNLIEDTSSKVKSLEGAKGGKVISKEVFTALALSSHVLLRSKINFNAVQFGAMLAEWFLIQSADPKVSGIQPPKGGSNKSGKSGGWSLMGGGGTEDEFAVLEDQNEVYNIVMESLSTDSHDIGEVDFKLSIGLAHMEIFTKLGMLAEPYHLKKSVAQLRDSYLLAKRQGLSKAMYADALNDDEALQKAAAELKDDDGLTVRQRNKAKKLRILPRMYLLAMMCSGDLTSAEDVAAELVQMRKKSLQSLPSVESNNEDDEAEVDDDADKDMGSAPAAAILSPDEIQMQKDLEKAQIANEKREAEVRRLVSEAYSTALMTLACVQMALTAYSKAMATLQEILNSPVPPLGFQFIEVSFVYGRCWELNVEQSVSMDHPLDGYLHAYEQWDKEEKAKEKEIRDRDERERRAWIDALKNAQEAEGFEPQDSLSLDGSIESKAQSEVGEERRGAINTVAAPILDLAHVIAERKKAKEEHFRRRKMLRKMRKAGLALPEEVDPEEHMRQERKKQQRQLVKRWLAQCNTWVGFADKFRYLNYPPFAADLYRQGILRDNSGFSNPNLWFRWAKASHRCSREYDVKLALNQAQHFEPGNKQIMRFRRHFEFIGQGKSTHSGENIEPRIDFDKKVRMAAHHSSDGFGESEKYHVRVRNNLCQLCDEIVSLPNIEYFEYYGALRITNFIRGVAVKMKKERERLEKERLEALWSENPAVAPQIVWNPPTDLYYPQPLTSEEFLNAYAPVPPKVKTSELDLGGDSDSDEDEMAFKYSRPNTRAKSRGTDGGGSRFGDDGSEEDDGPQIKTIEGEWTYEPGADDPLLNAGEHVLKVTFTPVELEKYLPTIAAVKVTVHKNNKIPRVEWPSPEPVRIGQVLTAKHLNARIVLLDEHDLGEDDGSYYGDSSLDCDDEDEEDVEEQDGESEEGNQVVSFAQILQREEEQRQRDYDASCMDGERLIKEGMGRLIYRPELGTKLPVGTHTIHVTYKPFDEANYPGTTATAEFVVLPYLSDVFWDSPAPICFPQKLTIDQLNAHCPTQGGTFVYEPSHLDDPLRVGSHTLHVSFWPYDYRNFGVVEKTVEFEVIKRTPTIQWPTPPIMYLGDNLSYDAHLNAMVIFEKRADVPDLTGVFRYTHDPYSYMNPAHHEIKCTFMPDDCDNYSLAEHTVVQTVRCKPTIKWAKVPVLRIGNMILKKHLCAKCSDCKGEYVYDPPVDTRADAGGERTFTVTLLPFDQTIYDVVTYSIVIDVVPKLKPELTWDAPVIAFGNRLSKENALCCRSDKPGYFTYAGDGVPHAFTLTPKQLANLTEEDKAKIAARPAILDSGKYVVQANFFPEDAENYSQQSLAVTLTVDRLVVELEYGPFADVTYGDAVKEDLHLTARITGIALEFLPTTGPDAKVTDSSFGSFSYNTTAGTLLKAGTHEITVTYTPTDTTNFSTAVVSVPLKVGRHQPVVDWPAIKAIYYSTLLSETQLCAKVLPNNRDLKETIVGELTYSWNIGHRFAKVGRHPVSCTFVPEDGFNYGTTHIEKEISVRRFPPKIDWERPEEIFEGQKLTEKELNATCDFPDLTLEDGKLEYDPPLGTKLESGEHHLLCKFVPNPKVKDNFDLRKAYSEVGIFIAPTRGGVKSRGR
jgi:hypothetical protein